MKHIGTDPNAVTAYDDEPIKSDLTALAIREATNESSAAFNLPGSFIETFTDDTNLGTQTTGDRTSGYWSTHYTAVGAFSNDANTKYLNHFEASDLDTDESSGSHSITHTGTGISRSDTQAKYGTYSMYGTGANTAFIRLPSHSDFAFSTDVDCTIEGWFYVTDVSGNKGLWGTVGNDFVLYVKDATLGYYISSDGSSWDMFNASSGSQTVTVDTWHHFAVVREGSTFTGYLNGVADKTASSDSIDLSQQFNLGSDIGTGTGAQSWGLNGYLDEVRFSDTARYTSSFTPGEVTTVNATGTLIQSANSVTGTRTEVGGTMLYADNEGTATLGTDLKIYFTCDGGSNWTETDTYTAITPVYASGIKQVRLGKMACTGGTDVRYKAVFANQSDGSLETRLHAIGINY